MIASIGGGTRGVTNLPVLVRGAAGELIVSWDVHSEGVRADLLGDGDFGRTLAGSGSVVLGGTDGAAGESPPDRKFTIRIASDDGARSVPQTFSLSQNYPNPFNSTTLIHFSLPVSGRVKVEIFSIVGELIATLTDDTMDAGSYSVPFDAAAIASGMYFYRMTAEAGAAGRFTATKKLLLIR